MMTINTGFRSRLFNPAAIVLACSLLCACSSSTIKPNELAPLLAKVGIDKRWQQQVGNGQGSQYRVIEPLIVGDSIYANDAQGNVFAFNAETGQVIWSKALSVDTATGLGGNDRFILAASLEGDVIALARETGEELWRANVVSEILSPPQTNDSVVVVQTNDGKLIGLQADTGERVWDYSVSLPVLTLRGTATPLLFGDNLVTGFANGKLMAFSAADGTLFWERRIARPQGRSDIERVVDIDGQPVIAGATLYTTSYNGTLSALSPNGTLLWSQPLSSYSQPVVVDGRIFVSTDDGIVRAFEAKSGVPLWENSSLLRRKLSAPQNLNGFVVIADYEGYVHIMDTETGVILSRVQIDSAGVRSPMVTASNKLYTLGNNGVLAAITVNLLDPSKAPKVLAAPTTE